MPKYRKQAPPSFALFGARVRTARERMGWTQTALAYHIGASQGEISEYENGVREPRYGSLRALCLALGCTGDHLLGLDERRASRKET